MRSAARSEPLPNRACPDEGEQAIMRHFLEKPGFLLARIDQICTSLYGDLSSGETLGQAEFLLLIDSFGVASQVALARAAGVDTSPTVSAARRRSRWRARPASTPPPLPRGSRTSPRGIGSRVGPTSTIAAAPLL